MDQAFAPLLSMRKTKDQLENARNRFGPTPQGLLPIPSADALDNAASVALELASRRRPLAHHTRKDCDTTAAGIRDARPRPYSAGGLRAADPSLKSRLARSWRCCRWIKHPDSRSRSADRSAVIPRSLEVIAAVDEPRGEMPCRSATESPYDRGLEAGGHTLFQRPEPFLRKDQHGSIGLKSGEYGGRKSNRARAPSTNERASGA